MQEEPIWNAEYQMSLKEYIGGQIRRTIDYISYLHNRGKINMNETIVISGVPRGGTTWVMELLETLDGYRSVFEPFHRGWFPEIKKLNLTPRPYLPPTQRNTELENYLTKVFEGKIQGRGPGYRLAIKTIIKRLHASKLLIKFVRANRLLPWISETFKLRANYLIMRHPCATIASQLETGYRGYFLQRSSPLPREIVLKEALLIPQVRENEWLVRKLQSIETQAEILALVWSLDNYVPLSYLTTHPGSIHPIIYEKLIVDFEEEIEKIFGFINEKVPKEAYEKFKKPSKTAHDKDYLGTQKQLLKWKNKLSKRQVEEILKVTHWFNLDFYTTAPEPEYDALKTWKPPF